MMTNISLARRASKPDGRFAIRDSQSAIRYSLSQRPARLGSPARLSFGFPRHLFVNSCLLFLAGCVVLMEEIMETMTEESTILAKTRELCQAILDEPNMRAVRERVDAFMGDEKARSLYDGLVSKGQALQQ